MAERRLIDTADLELVPADNLSLDLDLRAAGLRA